MHREHRAVTDRHKAGSQPDSHTSRDIARHTQSESQTQRQNAQWTDVRLKHKDMQTPFQTQWQNTREVLVVTYVHIKSQTQTLQMHESLQDYQPPARH